MAVDERTERQGGARGRVLEFPVAHHELAHAPIVGGVRLNHRCVWVLQIIGAEPGLSNKEIARRAGIVEKSHSSELLARLRRLGLIRNMQPDPTPAVPNAWQLTRSGRELERAIHHELPGAGGLRGPRSKPVRKPSARKPAARRLTDIFSVPEQPADREATVLAAFEQALEQAGTRARAAYEAEEGWLERIRAGLTALLELFDEQPQLARLCVVESAQAGAAVLARRAQVLAQLAWVLDEERAPARGYPPPLTAETLVSGVLGVLHERLTRPDAGALTELSRQLMSIIVLPYLGARASRRELLCPATATKRAPVGRKAALELLQGNSGKAVKRHLTPRVLHVVAAEPGLSNVEVAKRAGIKDQGHMSRLLARLTRLGLVENRLDAKALPSTANVWHLTASGAELEQAIRPETAPINGAAARASAPVAVSETATAIARGGASSWRVDPLRRESLRLSAREYLRLLAAFDLPLLHCVCCEAFRALLATVASRFPWTYKRYQARYSIPLTKVKLEPLQASERTASSLFYIGDKSRRGVCLRQPVRSFGGSRGQMAARAEAHIDRPPSPQHRSSSIARHTVSQGLRRFEKELCSPCRRSASTRTIP